MLKSSRYFLTALCLVLIFGCGGGGGGGDSSDQPSGSNNTTSSSGIYPHPSNWDTTHDSAPPSSLQECKTCHGADFSGKGDAVSCYSCHIEGYITIHPTSWTNVIVDHKSFSNGLNWTSCNAAICHGVNLQGGGKGPSCFNLSCHSKTGGDIPAPASHGESGFIDGASHGAVGRPALNKCLNCHGRPENIVDGGFISDPTIMNNTDNKGLPVRGNCKTCHTSAYAHPTNWQGTNDSSPDYVSSHRFVNEEGINSGCALCHKVDGLGSGKLAGAPSCFSSSHTNKDGKTSGCHPNGSQPYSHPLPSDGSDVFYNFILIHGKEAKKDLTRCQICHANPSNSGPGSNPRFNIPSGGCESCHGAYLAHPATWAGPNDWGTTHYSAKNINNSCTLCHGVALDGKGGVNAAGSSPGQSCLDCHAETNEFTLDCTACHGYPPDGTTPEAKLVGGIPVNHRNVTIGLAGDLHGTCSICHGVKATGASSGKLLPLAEYKLYDPTNDVLGDHWNGKVNMNGPTNTGAGYNQNNFGCDNAGVCHGNDGNHQLSDSALPLQFGNYFTPHAGGDAFLAGTGHGALAKGDLASCKICHGEETSVNPRFIFGIYKAGGIGCEGCHSTGTAHPSSAAPDNTNWYDGPWRHHNTTISKSTCGMCHQRSGWPGTLAPPCTSCHVSDPANAVAGTCTSCHGDPPNGTTPPNRGGRHYAHKFGCATCHTNAGPGSALHFTKLSSGFARADLRSSPNVTGTDMTITVTPDNVTCTNTCHEVHLDDHWY